VTVSSAITLAQRILKDGAGRPLLLSIFDARVKELYADIKEVSQVYFDPTTGRHPYLVTTAGTYIYDFPSWARSISRIYDVDDVEEGRHSYPDYAVTIDPSKRKIVFAEDPGTEATKYRVIGTYGPTDMTSETDSLCIVPSEKRFPLCVCGMVAGIQPLYKGWDESRWQELKLNYRQWLRGNAQPIPRERTLKTEFGMEYYGTETSDYRKRY
jgi:hypothetical protein